MTIPDSKLKTETLELMRTRPHHIKYGDISAATTLSKAWLSNFVTGLIKEPSVDKVELLNTFLKK